MFPIGSTRIRMLLAKFGDEAVVERKDIDGTDQLNNATGTWNIIGTTLCSPYYKGMNEQVFMNSGTYDTDRPVLAFPRDTIVEDGDRVNYQDTTYSIESLTLRKTYILAEVKRVDAAV